jgi:hypothetical protein
MRIYQAKTRTQLYKDQSRYDGCTRKLTEGRPVDLMYHTCPCKIPCRLVGRKDGKSRFFNGISPATTRMKERTKVDLNAVVMRSKNC